MRNRKILNVIMIVLAVGLLVYFGTYVRIAAAANSVAVLKTSGMTCGSCSNKIMDALQSVKGVAVVEVDVEGGWVIVGYDTEKVGPEALAEKVSASGFGSDIQTVITPDEFKQITGREIGIKSSTSSGCGCGPAKKS